MGLFTRIGDQIISKANVLTHLSGGGSGSSSDGTTIVNAKFVSIDSDSDKVAISLDKTYGEMETDFLNGKTVIIVVNPDEIITDFAAAGVDKGWAQYTIETYSATLLQRGLKSLTSQIIGLAKQNNKYCFITTDQDSNGQPRLILGYPVTNKTDYYSWAMPFGE